ncbi:MAG: adenylate kinase [Bacteroidaceae bacterium]|nr:adenylate kinase [Bacteroidaceae bacterium]
MKFYILFGPPGAGKGTHAGAIAEKYNLKHVSTGELLRSEIAAGTELGKMAKNLIEAGNLVPDYVVEGMIEHLFHTTKDVAGFLLDGFPRTVQQAEDLDRLLAQRGEKVNAVISIMISDATVRERLKHRAAIEGRADDASDETISNRIVTYHKKTEPLIAYYKQADVYREVSGECGGVEAVRAQLFDLFNGMDTSFLGEQVIMDNALFDLLEQQAHDTPRLRMNYDLRNTTEDDSQRMLNVWLPGSKLEVHRHQHSNETVLLLKGKMDVVLYNDDGTEAQRIHMGGNSGVYGINIPKNVWHTVEAFKLAVTFTAKDGAWAPNAPEDILEVKR